MILIRADANERIGTGHLMRCLTIARACAGRGQDICFAVREEEGRAFLMRQLRDEENYKVIVLGESLRNPEDRGMEEELPVISRLAGETGARWILVDSYDVTEEYLRRLRQQFRTAYIDDIMAFDYPVDLLINYDLVTREKGKSNRGDFYRAAARLLLGAQYAPLREEFFERTCLVKENPKHILITTGGGDLIHGAEKVVDALLKRGMNCDFHVVIGSLRRDNKRLEELAEAYPNIILHREVKNMGELMEGCDIGVSAAGTTLYELCAVGLPSVSFSFSENQISCGEAFSRAGVIPYMGDVRHGDRYHEIAGEVCRLYSDYARRTRVSRGMRELVDGRGAERIAEAFCGGG